MFKMAQDFDMDENEAVEEAFDELMEQLRGSSFEELGDALNQICNDSKLYEFLCAGFGDGEFVETHMNSSQDALPVKRLIPLQREIGLDNSLAYPLSGDCATYFNSPVTIVAPIVTYCGMFIVDGHHRWSQLYMVNPEADIAAINFDYSDQNPLRVLRNFQGAIAVAEGNVPSQVVGLADVYSMSEDEIRDYVASNITDQCVESLMSLVPGGLEDEDAVIEYIVGNAMEMVATNKPYGDAPERKYMPQTTDEAIDVAEEGQTNI